METSFLPDQSNCLFNWVCCVSIFQYIRSCFVSIYLFVWSKEPILICDFPEETFEGDHIQCGSIDSLLRSNMPLPTISLGQLSFERCISADYCNIAFKDLINPEGGFKMFCHLCLCAPSVDQLKEISLWIHSVGSLIIYLLVRFLCFSFQWWAMLMKILRLLSMYIWVVNCKCGKRRH